MDDLENLLNKEDQDEVELSGNTINEQPFEFANLDELLNSKVDENAIEDLFSMEGVPSVFNQTKMGAVQPRGNKSRKSNQTNSLINEDYLKSLVKSELKKVIEPYMKQIIKLLTNNGK